MPYRPRLTVRSAIVVGLLLAGCQSSGSSYQSEPFTTGGQASEVHLIVQNRNFADVRLYALRRGRREILGTVGGKTDAEYDIDWDLSDPLQIEIDLLAGPTCFTRELLVDPGDIIELQIAPTFSQSAACR